jgi:hypothetical protein
MRLDNTAGLLRGIIQEQFPEAPEHQCIACALVIRDVFNKEDEIAKVASYSFDGVDEPRGVSAYPFKLGYEIGIHHCLLATQKVLGECEPDVPDYMLNFSDLVKQELKKKEETQ